MPAWVCTALTESGWQADTAMYSEVQIHDQQQDAVKKAQARTETTLSETIRKEGRTRHLEDFIGLWVAASKSFHKTADQVANKHQKTREYEISTGLKILMTLQEDAMRKMQFLIDEYGSNEDKARHTNVVRATSGARSAVMALRVCRSLIFMTRCSRSAEQDVQAVWT